MRFADAAMARRVGVATGQEWLSDPAEVAVPSVLVDLAVSHHFGVVVPDDLGCVRGWWLPDENGFPLFCTPADPLIEGDLHARQASAAGSG